MSPVISFDDNIRFPQHLSVSAKFLTKMQVTYFLIVCALSQQFVSQSKKNTALDIIPWAFSVTLLRRKLLKPVFFLEETFSQHSEFLKELSVWVVWMFLLPFLKILIFK